jgi:hypothetical protein
LDEPQNLDFLFLVEERYQPASYNHSSFIKKGKLHRRPDKIKQKCINI